MDLSSLPSFPAVRERMIRRIEQVAASGVLLNLLLIVGIALFIFGLHRLSRAARPAAALAPIPVDFRIVMENIGKIRHFVTTREEAIKLLGPPTEYDPLDPTLPDKEADLEHSHRYLGLPTPRRWARWSDPKDDRRQVSILFARETAYSTIYSQAFVEAMQSQSSQ